MSQDQIARMTGKPKSEISRFLSMQRVAPEVQKQIRGDTENRFSRRHVVAISQLPPEEQTVLAQQVVTQKLSAVETEKDVSRRKQREMKGEGARGAPVTVRRYVIGSTKVQFTIRKKNVTTKELLEILDRIRVIIRQSGDDKTLN